MADRRIGALFLLGLFSFRGFLAASDEVFVDTLRFSGDFEGGESILSRAALVKTAGVREIEAEIVPRTGAVSLTVLPLAALIAAYPLENGADGLILETDDRWESFVTLEYIGKRDPVLLLYYDGEGPEVGNWPMFGGDIEALAPYYVFTPDEPLPTYPSSPPYGMIAATQITGIRAASTAERYAPFFEAPMDQLSALGQEGRRLFLQRCNTCHQGPGGVGGNTSQRPFIILQTHAAYNADYFRKVVSEPKTVFPETIMPPHADFGEAQFSALLAFLKESKSLSEQ